MTYQEWLDKVTLIADPSKVDPNWLARQHSSGVAPMAVAQAIRAGTAPAAPVAGAPPATVPQFAAGVPHHGATHQFVCPRCGCNSATVVFDPGSTGGESQVLLWVLICIFSCGIACILLPFVLISSHMSHRKPRTRRVCTGCGMEV